MGEIIYRHTMKDVEKTLGPSEVIEEERCSKCGGILVTNYGDGISCTICVDCGDNEYNYE